METNATLSSGRVKQQTVTRNTLALIGDFFFFSIGFAFFDPVVVVPAFVNEFTGSELLIGALAALRVLMVTVPQIWAASMLEAQPRMKPLLMWSSFWGRLLIVVLAGAVLLWVETQTWLVILILALTVMVFYTSEGLNGVSWPALVGKVIPEGSRGRFFGLGQFLASIGAAAAGYFVNRVLALQQMARADRWALLFLCGFVALMLSVVSMLFIREEPVARDSDRVDVRGSLKKMWRYLREDRWLRRVIIAQLTMSTASAVFVFLIVRVRQVVPEAGDMIGTFVVLQSVGGAVAALVGGLLVDKIGSWAAIRAASSAHILVLLAAAVAGLGTGSLPLYFLAFLFMGFAGGASWWSFTAFMLDLASEERRPIYLAACGILASVTVLSPLIAGALFEALLPEVVFGGAGVLAVVGTVLVWKLRQAVTFADAVAVESGAASP